MKKIPKGMSDYQATWIGESDEEDVSDVSGDEVFFQPFYAFTK